MSHTSLHDILDRRRPACRLLARAATAMLMLALTACDDVTCPLKNTVESIYNFYASARTEDGTFVEGQAIGVGDTITIVAIDTAEIYINKLYNADKCKLPVSFYRPADSLRWVFTDSKGATASDTIVIFKTSHHHFDDPSCPVHIWHHIDSIAFTDNVIDTIIIASPEVNYDGLENFKIYFRTNQSSDEEHTTDADDDTGSDDDTQS